MMSPDQTIGALTEAEIQLLIALVELDELMQRKRLLAEELREKFAAECRSYLCDHLIAESADPAIPYDPNVVRQRRYLYRARQHDAAAD